MVPVLLQALTIRSTISIRSRSRVSRATILHLLVNRHTIGLKNWFSFVYTYRLAAPGSDRVGRDKPAPFTTLESLQPYQWPKLPIQVHAHAVTHTEWAKLSILEHTHT